MFQVESQGAVDVVSVQGPLTTDSVEDLQETLDTSLSGGQPMVVLNLTGVPLMDSAGLDALLDTRDRINQLGGTVKLSGLTPLCEEVLRVTGVGSHFECHSGTKSAVGALSNEHRHRITNNDRPTVGIANDALHAGHRRS